MALQRASGAIGQYPCAGTCRPQKSRGLQPETGGRRQVTGDRSLTDRGTRTQATPMLARSRMRGVDPPVATHLLVARSGSSPIKPERERHFERVSADVAESVGVGHVATALKRFFGAASSPPADRYASSFGILVAGLLFLVAGGVFVSALVNLWPAVDVGTMAESTSRSVKLFWGAYTAHLTKTTGLFVLAILMGAIGGYVHATTSFVTYIGNRQFKASWGWWYALRAFIGASLALLIYVAFRAGFLSGTTGTTAVDPYGIAAVSGLAGLFSKQATDKLEEIFTTAFHTAGDAGDQKRADKIVPGVPLIYGVAPTTLPAGPSEELTVTGTGFLQGSRIEANGIEQETEFIDAGRLRSNLATEQYKTGDTVAITVLNPTGGRSDTRPVTIS